MAYGRYVATVAVRLGGFYRLGGEGTGTVDGTLDGGADWLAGLGHVICDV